MKKRIYTIGVQGLPAKYGGFETFTDYLSRYISDDFDLIVYCSSNLYKDKKEKYQKATLKYIPLNANGIQSVPYDIFSILLALNDSKNSDDVLLLLGSSGAIILPFISLFTKRNIVFNMAGLEWKRSKWNRFARWFLKFSEKIAVRYADAIVTDNRGLQEYIASEYGAKSHMIAYGGDHATRLDLTDEVTEKYPFLKEPYYIGVARAQSDNNIDVVLEAFSKIPDKNLVFVANWNVSDYGKSLKEKYSKISNLHLVDAIYDLQILDQLRSNCVAYIHAQSSGGTNPSLVEAMHLELPIIAADVNFNRYTTDNKAFYFADVDELIDNILHNDKDAYDLSAKEMKKTANQIYTWKYIVSEYEKLF